MHDTQSPDRWTAPSWHSDFGNARLELDHLREFSKCLLSVAPNLSVSLETPEPGLMDVEVRLDDETTAEVYSVPSQSFPGKRCLAIFFSPGTMKEEEVYAESTDNAVSEFTSRLSV